MSSQAQLDRLCVNTLRTLSIDAVEQAQSGHPGTPMGAAPTVYSLWQYFLHYDPDHPDWPDRDRFVLSAGHACALLYSLLHLADVKTASGSKALAVPLEQLKNFRQLGSLCSGHPEYGLTTGVETTTGPLGQGIATSVGSEAASLAGHLKLAGLRAMPNMMVIRPADANVVLSAWRVIMKTTQGPVSLVLTRQALPTLDRIRYASADGLAQGAYALADAPDGQPDILLLATGSEVALCVAAYEQLTLEGVKARVVSMPSWELFESQIQAYRDSVLPPTITARVAVEAASPFGWERYTSLHGTILAMHTFGISAPGKQVASHFGFEPEDVIRAARAQLTTQGKQP
ncbi:hypothetical protein H0A66_01535 [Alcaligenaceae bacterium]|nr:hypothetical protein [Alcaligenaceae bacterium]